VPIAVPIALEADPDEAAERPPLEARIDARDRDPRRRHVKCFS